jgi:hypothetical protein
MALKQVVGAAFETPLYAWQRHPAGDARHNVTAIQPIAPFALVSGTVDSDGKVSLVTWPRNPPAPGGLPKHATEGFQGNTGRF